MWWRELNNASNELKPLTIMCCGPAGSNANFFLKYAKELDNSYNVKSLLLPAREAKFLEEPIIDMDNLVEQICEETIFDDQIILFGHSMGASIASEIADKLVTKDKKILALVVSGRAGPRTQWEYPKSYKISDQELINGLKELGGIDTELFDDPEFIELLLPSIKADYELLDNYKPSLDIKYDFPIYGLRGSDDPTVSASQMSTWIEKTSSTYSEHSFEGGHMYIMDNFSELAVWFNKTFSVSFQGLKND